MGGRRLNWSRLAGYLFAIVALLWVFHDVDFASMATMARGIAAWWLIPAVVCDVLSYICQGERWRLLVRPIGPLSLAKAVQAIYAGLFTNEVLPLRFGEIVRAYLASRALCEPVAALIPSIAVERLIDSFWLAVGSCLLLLWVPLPAELARTAELFGVVVAGFVGIFVYLALKPPSLLIRWSQRRDSRIRALIGATLFGMSRVGLNGTLGVAVLYSLIMLLFQAAAFWFVMISCKLSLGYAAAAAVFLIVHLGTALPNAPANVGGFQFFTVLGLRLFGVEKTLAAGFSVVVFIVLTVPLWVLGLAALSTSGVSLSQIRPTLDPSRSSSPIPTPERFQRMDRVWPEQPF
jgi:uncharacterized protein (TIRG00374 family)